MEKSISLRG